MSNVTSIDVCICTIGRPSLEQAIMSVLGQELPETIPVRIIVADNSPDRATEARVARLASGARYPIQYCHAPAFNISIARNACLDGATASHIAFIDDDEEADPAWLAALRAGADNHEVVLGTVEAVYDPATAPRWMIAGDFHSTRIGPRDKPEKGYTGNVLIDRAFVRHHGFRFDPALGQVGGEDTMFFLAVHRAGGRFAFRPDALVHEPVPGNRARWGWLARRHFRSGQIRGLILRQGHENRMRNMLVALAKVVVAAITSIACLPNAEKRAAHLLRSLFHTGVVATLSGVALYREYSPPNPD